MKRKTIFALFTSLLLIGTTFAQDGKNRTARANTVPLRIAEQAPDFSLNDENGKVVTLSKLKQNVVLVFYRGYW